MESKNELKGIDTKNHTCYYFNIIRFWDRENILLDEKLYKEKYKNILFMKLHTKLQRVQNHCVLGSIKQMDLLRLMIKLDI